MADEPRVYSQEEVDALIAEHEGGLKANRDEVLAELKRAKQALKNYDGVDPDEFRRLKAAAEDAERKKLAAEGDFKSLEKQLLERHQKDMEGRDGRIKSLTSALEQYLIDAEASKEIAALKGSVKGLLPHVKPFIRVVEQDGQFVSQVVDAHGRPRIGDAKGGPMTIAQLVEEMRGDTDLARLFDGSGSSGGGATRSVGGADSSRVVTADDNAAFLANLEGIASGKVEVR